MAKAKSSKPAAGQRVRVNEGTSMPEFPDLSISGWTGTIMETVGTGAKLKIILEWDDATVEKIPASYQSHCESQGLMASMACLPAADLEINV